MSSKMNAEQSNMLSIYVVELAEGAIEASATIMDASEQSGEAVAAAMTALGHAYARVIAQFLGPDAREEVIERTMRNACAQVRDAVPSYSALMFPRRGNASVQ